MATAGCAWATQRATSSGMRMVESTSEYSLCRWRWAKAGICRDVLLASRQVRGVSTDPEAPVRSAFAVAAGIHPHVVLPQRDFGQAVADPRGALFAAGADRVAFAAVGAEVAVV